jgi:hypothetical protein
MESSVEASVDGLTSSSFTKFHDHVDTPLPDMSIAWQYRVYVPDEAQTPTTSVLLRPLPHARRPLSFPLCRPHLEECSHIKVHPALCLRTVLHRSLRHDAGGFRPFLRYWSILVWRIGILN